MATPPFRQLVAMVILNLLVSWQPSFAGMATTAIPTTHQPFSSEDTTSVPRSCSENQLQCQHPYDTCLPMSNQCDGESDCPAAWDEASCPDPDETFCPDNFEHVPRANAGYCYHLKNMSEGTVHFPEALAYCLTLNAFLVRPNSLAQVEALADYLDITDDVIAGYWMGYKRRSAPRVNGTLSPENASIRKDKTEFYDIYSQCPRIQMPEELWRAPNQPGEKTDERDEQCVAKKRPGKKAPAKFVGADDYSCVNKQQHYVICEKCHQKKQSQGAV